MTIGNEIIQELKNSADENKENEAHKLLEEDKVKITKVIYDNKNNFSIKGIIPSNLEEYHTYIYVKDGEIQDLNCTCPEYESTYGTCKHILATALEFNTNAEYIRMTDAETNKIPLKNKEKNNEKYRIYRQMINSFYQEEQR